MVSGTALPLGKEPLINAERCCCLNSVCRAGDYLCTLEFTGLVLDFQKISEEFSIIKHHVIN